MGFIQDMLCIWQLPQLPVEGPWSALAGPFLTLLAKTAEEAIHLPLWGHHLWKYRQFSVRWSVHWSESPDHLKLTNKWV